MRRRGVVYIVAAAVMVVVAIVVAASVGNGHSASANGTTTSSPSGAHQTTISLESAHFYTPHAPAGATDDYHCTLVDPHLTSNQTIVSSDFIPNSPEVHHAILFLVPPALAAQAKADDDVGKGWTCFGEAPLPGSGISQIGELPWLSGWAPGHGKDVVPAGTGIAFPKGSLVVMQIHYNLLVGDKPVKAKLILTTVPASTPLKPLYLDLLPAPPDIPCPSGVTGPLCDRAASLADTAQRFGESQVQFINLLEDWCRGPAAAQNPPGGDSTSCVWPAQPGTIMRVTAHMHLTGTGMKIVLNPGTPGAKTLLNVTNYNFDYQRSYNITPVTVSKGDKIQVTCTYNPRLRQELPQLRKLPARYVTWGDGSSDEMCLGLINYTSNSPNSRRHLLTGWWSVRYDGGQHLADRPSHDHVGQVVELGRLGIHDHDARPGHSCRRHQAGGRIDSQGRAHG